MAEATETTGAKHALRLRTAALAYSDSPVLVAVLTGAAEAMDDLLAACQKLRRSDLPDNEQPMWDELQAAIAKATGGAA